MRVFGNDNVFAPAAVQRILDAAAQLQVQRSRHAAALTAGERPDARVVASGWNGINDWIREASAGWRELWSVRLTGTVETLRDSLPVNRARVSAGKRMISVFDYHRTEPTARLLLSGERLGRYLFSHAPVQMKIVDRRRVLLQGPDLDGEPTLMEVEAKSCVAAATSYWRALLEPAVPCSEVEVEIDGLSDRQRQVVALLAADSNDQQIAAALGVSLRTVRYDIAGVMELLGARSRFAAGLRLSQLRAELRPEIAT